jgi:hypothetical protein
MPWPRPWPVRTIAAAVAVFLAVEAVGTARRAKASAPRTAALLWRRRELDECEPYRD